MVDTFFDPYKSLPESVTDFENNRDLSMIKKIILLILFLTAVSRADDGLKVADLKSVKCDEKALKAISR